MTQPDPWPPVDEFCRRAGGEPEPDEDTKISARMFDEPTDEPDQEWIQ